MHLCFVLQVTNQTPPSSPPTQQQQQEHKQESVGRHNPVETASENAALMIVPDSVEDDGGADADDVDFECILPRSAPDDCRDDERAFLEGFQMHIVFLLRYLRHHYPYQQRVKWTIKYGNGRKHTFHILIKPPRSADQH